MPMDKGRPQVMSHEERKTIMAKSAAPVRMDTPSEWESGEEEDLGEDEGWWWSHGASSQLCVQRVSGGCFQEAVLGRKHHVALSCVAERSAVLACITLACSHPFSFSLIDSHFLTVFLPGGYDNSDTCPNGALTIPDDMCQSDGCYQGLQTAAFRDCSTLTSVTLPSSIWWIPHYSFDSCTALTSVTMTSNIYWTGRASFYGCSSLATLDLNNVRWVCNSAFSGCSSLSSVSMPNVWWIDWHAFEGCESLSSVTVPSNCYRMAPQAFDANTNVNGNCRYRWRV